MDFQQRFCLLEVLDNLVSHRIGANLQQTWGARNGVEWRALQSINRIRNPHIGAINYTNQRAFVPLSILYSILGQLPQ